LGNLPKDTSTTLIETSAAEAERVMRLFLGEVYESAVAESENDNPQTRRNKLARAEAFLTLERLLPIMAIRANPESGGLVGSVGFGESRTSLLSNAEVEAICNRYNDWAMEIISEFVTVDDDDSTVGDGISVLAV